MAKSKKKFSALKIDKILKKQKIVCSFWNCSDKRDSTYQNYYLLFKRIFGKTILFDPRKERFLHNSKKMNELFFELIKKEKPNYLFTNVRRDEQTIETMMEVKKISPKTKTLMFSGDDDLDFEPLKRYQALFVDCTLVAQIEYIKNYYNDGIKNVYPMIPSDEESNKPLKLKKIYDVTFIGKPNKYRVNDLRFLAKNNINFKIFGRGWDDYPDLMKFYGGSPEMEEKNKIINQSKINLSLSKNKEGILHFKGRVFSRASCKAFSLTESFDGYLKFFDDGKEIIMFNNQEDLLKKIKYYLKHDKERKTIAENAYRKYTQNYSGTQWFKNFFREVMENPETFSQKLPEVKEKIITLKKEDFEKNNKEIEKSLKKFDYISFSDGNSVPLNYKDYLQSYSLEKTGKKISCCDYHVYDKILGNYLTTKIYKAFRLLKIEEFSQAITINQIAVTKNYFLKNINKFREFFNGKKIDVINKENVCLISIPLVKIKKINKMKNKTFLNFFHRNFIIDLYFLLKQKKIFTSPYFYRLTYLLIKNPSLMRSFISSIKDKKNWKNAVSL